MVMTLKKLKYKTFYLVLFHSFDYYAIIVKCGKKVVIKNEYASPNLSLIVNMILRRYVKEPHCIIMLNGEKKKNGFSVVHVQETMVLLRCNVKKAY